MSEFIKLLTSYNLFNSLLPGVIYVVLVKECTKYNFIQSDILIGFFLYYFIGIIINRVGSLVLESLLKRVAPHKPTSEYIRASKQDQKIEVLSEVNNMFRSIIAAIILIVLTKIYELIDVWLKIPSVLSCIIIMILLLGLFVFAYKKQTGYIRTRIETALKGKR